MIWRIILVLVAVVLAVVGIGIYLSPDDLAGCQKPSETGRCQAADAIVVISGGDTNARTDEAIKLFKDSWAPLVVVSGAAADKTGLSNAEAMRQRALNHGVPDGSVLVEDKSETTKQNASEVGRLLSSRGVKRVILVTSGYHMRRAQIEFSSQLPNFIILPHPVAVDRHWSPVWWLTPWGWWMALSELVKILVVYIGGSH